MKKLTDFLAGLVAKKAVPSSIDDILDRIESDVEALHAAAAGHAALAQGYERSAQDSLAKAQENRLETARAMEAAELISKAL